VCLADALDGCDRILKDEFQDYPESAFYMIGAIEEVNSKTHPKDAAEPAMMPRSPAKPPASSPSPARAKQGADVH
jgi:F-type H+-transporting ATPase subunit beta